LIFCTLGKGFLHRNNSVGLWGIRWKDIKVCGKKSRLSQREDGSQKGGSYVR
jgi:hypothetical protein